MISDPGGFEIYAQHAWNSIAVGKIKGGAAFILKSIPTQYKEARPDQMGSSYVLIPHRCPFPIVVELVEPWTKTDRYSGRKLPFIQVQNKCSSPQNSGLQERVPPLQLMKEPKLDKVDFKGRALIQSRTPQLQLTRSSVVKDGFKGCSEFFAGDLVEWER